MGRSIATAQSRPAGGGQAGGYRERLRQSFAEAELWSIGLFFVVLAFGIYLFSNPARMGFYDHFVWQADAFWHGRFVIAFPVTDGLFTNDYFQDVMPIPAQPGEASFALLPFPPLPAILLMPFVAIFGLATDAQLVGVAIGAINVGLAWRLAMRVTDDRRTGFLATLFFAFGTVHWYASMLATTWFLAHLVAITFVLLGITLAIDAERRFTARRRLENHSPGPLGPRGDISETFEQSSLLLRAYRRVSSEIDPLQFAAGLVFGLAALARLPVVFGAPFFLFVGGGGSFWRRGLAAGLGASIPLVLLLVYNLAATGHVFNPAYDYLYRTEYVGYLPPENCFFSQEVCDSLFIDRSLHIEDLGHLPLNALIMFAWLPIVQPECGLRLLDPTCPLLQPDAIGMSVLLTSPGWLLAIPAILFGWRRRIVAGAALAIVPIAILNLMHFSQGWVQFGYRFSNDFAPFGLILVTLGIAWLGARRGIAGRLLIGFAVVLVAASIVVNAWGVYWGVTLGW